MPEKEMRPVKVYISEPGFVCISQEQWGESEPAAIALHHDQVPLLIDWLRETAEEAKRLPPAE